MLRGMARATVGVASAIAWCLGLLCICAPAAHGQAAPQGQQSLPVVRELSRGETVHFLAPPPVLVEFPIKCDGGDIFVAYSANPYRGVNGGPSPPITEVRPNSKSTVEFGMPPIDGYDRQDRHNFALGPNGTLYALISASRTEAGGKGTPRPEYFIEKFKEDGTRDSLTKLVTQAGATVQPMVFGVFNNGTYLVTGMAFGHANAEPFTAIFDSSGRLVRSVRLPDDVRAAPVAHRPPPPPKPGADKEPQGNGSSLLAVSFGGLVSAVDGNVYLIRASNPIKIYSISPGGEVVNQAQAPIPESDMNLMEVGASAAGLYLEFGHVANGVSAESSEPRDMVALFDLAIKRFVAFYRLPVSVSQDWVPACADNQGNFSFLGEGTDGRLEITTYTQH
ncbi:MAG TPA: hypothetical protein VJR26_00945 [Candidatus Acidoferrales bacterium]|nr:hypothetical protein [Candidatus Acidoferrales bacterium]